MCGGVNATGCRHVTRHILSHNNFILVIVTAETDIRAEDTSICQIALTLDLVVSQEYNNLKLRT